MKIPYHKKGIENNLRWLFMKGAFERIETPDTFLIGHSYLIPELTITKEDWKDFSEFCNLCDTIACLRQEGMLKMSCLSMWMGYECGKT